MRSRDDAIGIVIAILGVRNHSLIWNISGACSSKNVIKTLTLQISLLSDCLAWMFDNPHLGQF